MKEKEQCSICWNHLKKKNMARTKCGHTFHLSCIMKAHCMYHSESCPICREPFYKKITIQDVCEAMANMIKYGDYNHIYYLLQIVPMPNDVIDMFDNLPDNFEFEREREPYDRNDIIYVQLRAHELQIVNDVKKCIQELLLQE